MALAWFFPAEKTQTVNFLYVCNGQSLIKSHWQQAAKRYASAFVFAFKPIFRKTNEDLKKITTEFCKVIVMAVPRRGFGVSEGVSEFPERVLEFPEEVLEFPERVMEFPKGFWSFPKGFLRFPKGFRSFPKGFWSFRRGFGGSRKGFGGSRKGFGVSRKGFVDSQ